MPSCFFEQHLSQQRPRTPRGHIPKANTVGFPGRVATAWTSAVKPLRESRD